jgi:carbonic anhydrase
MIQDLLTGNNHFIAEEFNKNLEYYHGLAQGQSPSVLWIGCSDSRVSEDVVTNSKPGTIFVLRNIANIVAFNDVNIAAILEYALVHLKIRDIVVCGHTRCGGIAAIAEGLQENYIADWLLIASGAKEEVERIAKERNLTREEKLNLLVEENVRLQIKHLQQFALIRNLYRKGDAPRIHGWVYMVETGLIKLLNNVQVGSSGNRSRVGLDRSCVNGYSYSRHGCPTFCFPLTFWPLYRRKSWPLSSGRPGKSPNSSAKSPS